MRVAIVSHYFHPEIGAPSARLHSLAKELLRLGHRVVVVTGFPNHPTGVLRPEHRGLAALREDLEGIEVLRNWLYATPNEGFVRKTLGHLSFMLTAVLLGGPRLGRVDVIVASSPTLFCVISAWVLSLLKGVPFVFEVRDLWPAVFVDLGVLKNRWLISILESLELFLYRRSAAVVTVTESFRRDIVRRGIDPEKVVTVTNGVDLEAFSPGAADPKLQASLEVRGRPVVLYLGAHGISQGLTTILEAARALRGRPVLLLFVGEGAEKKKLREQAAAWGLDNVAFLDGQARDEVLRYYRLADVCLVPLRDVPLFDTFIPSKMFEIMACGRPIVASVRGEAREILERSGAALIAEPGDASGIARAIETLLEDPERGRRMAQSGRRFVAEHYQRAQLARRYEQTLLNVSGASESPS